MVKIIKVLVCFVLLAAFIVATPTTASAQIPGSPYTAIKIDEERLYELLTSAVQAGSTTRDFSIMENVYGTAHESIDVCRYWQRVKDARALFLANYATMQKSLYERRIALVEQRYNKQMSAIRAQVCKKSVNISSRVPALIAAPVVSPYYEIDCQLGQIDGDIHDLNGWWDELNSAVSLAVLAPSRENADCVPYCDLSRLAQIDIVPNSQNQIHTPNGVDKVLEFSVADRTDGLCERTVGSMQLMSVNFTVTVVPSVADGKQLCGKLVDLQIGAQRSVCGNLKSLNNDSSLASFSLDLDRGDPIIFQSGTRKLEIVLDTSLIWQGIPPSSNNPRLLVVSLGESAIQLQPLGNPSSQPTNSLPIVGVSPLGTQSVTIRY